MPSPFPGMDPYLEGYLWPDVHQRLAVAIADQLTPQVSPAYVVRINLYTVEDTSPEEDVGILYPDVEVFHPRTKAEEPGPGYFTPVTVSVPATQMVKVRIPVTEIRDRKTNQLITAIEILSPVNKRKPGLSLYREKRRRLYQSGVHLLEIDLLRRGERPFNHPRIPASHYLVALVRADAGKTDTWAFNIREPLPVVPAPLKKEDEDVRLDLGAVLEEIYERGQYQLSIDYRKPPPATAFGEVDQNWMQELLSKL